MRALEVLNLVEQIGVRIIACAIHFSNAALGLHLRDLAADATIVPDVAGAAHRTDDALVGKQPLNRKRRLRHTVDEAALQRHGSISAMRLIGRPCARRARMSLR